VLNFIDGDVMDSYRGVVHEAALLVMASADAGVPESVRETFRRAALDGWHLCPGE
jgi:hypothetical protein